MSKTIQTILFVFVGFAVVTSPATTKFINGLIPVAVIFTVLIGALRVLWYLTRF
jgi:hypothetical protein